MLGEHEKAGADEGGLETGKEGGFAGSDCVVTQLGLAGKGGGAGIDGVHVVPDGGRAHATEGGNDPGEEEAVTGGGSGGVFGGFLVGTFGDDGMGVDDGGGEVAGEQRAADSEVDGNGLLESWRALSLP